MLGVVAAGVAGLAFLFALATHVAYLDWLAVDLTLIGLVGLSLAAFDLANNRRP